MAPLLIDESLKSFLEKQFPRNIIGACKINSENDHRFIQLKILGVHKFIHYVYTTYIDDIDKLLHGRVELHFFGSLAALNKELISAIADQIQKDKREDITYGRYSMKLEDGYYFSLQKDITTRDDLKKYLSGFMEYLDPIIHKYKSSRGN